MHERKKGSAIAEPFFYALIRVRTPVDLMKTNKQIQLGLRIEVISKIQQLPDLADAVSYRIAVLIQLLRSQLDIAIAPHIFLKGLHQLCPMQGVILCDDGEKTIIIFSCPRAVAHGQDNLIQTGFPEC